MSEVSIGVPEVVYSPIVPVAKFATNRCDPETAIEVSPPSPVMSEALTVAPEVVHSPIVVPAATNRSDPDTASTGWALSPDKNEASIGAPEDPYSPTRPVWGPKMVTGPPLLLLATKISSFPRAVFDAAQTTAAVATARKGRNKARDKGFVYIEG